MLSARALGPPGRGNTALLLAGAAGLAGLTATLGRVVAERCAPIDEQVSAWFLRKRRPGLTALTRVGTGLADTSTAVALTATAALALRWRLGRWHESLLVLACMSGELAIFLVSSHLIGRERPSIPHLDRRDPPTGSYPSGHTSAAVALYGSIAYVLVDAFEPPPAGRLACQLWWLIPVAVGTSRVYRGMHHASDVVAGAVTGGAWTLLVVGTSGRRP